MKLEDIDHLFKNNERQFDQMPNEQVWSRLEQRLGQALVSEKTDNAATVKVVQFGKLRRFLAAAAIILVILSPLAWYLLNTSNSADKQMAVNTAAPSTANYEPTETTDSAVVNALLEEDNAATSRRYTLPDDETLSQKATPIKQANKPSENQVFSSERKLPTLASKQPESNETSFADDSRPSKEIYAPPVMSKPATPQPVAQSVASGTVGIKENSNLQDQLSSVGKTNTVNPPLADVSFTRYYLGIDANEQPDSYAKTTTVAPIITNNSGKPFYPAQTETAKQKKQISQKERTSDVAAPAAKDDTPIPNITLKTLSWLWGTWTGTVNNAAISEKWLPDGTANISTTVNGNTYFSETATIKPSGKGLVYTIFNPQAGNIVTYQLSDFATVNNLIFENKDNSIAYPGIIAYHLVSDNTLYVTFTGFDPNGQPLQTTLLYQRQ